ncbi:hypothetical protein [Tuwongella immobilis]|uniref:Uncharacterized protein n=1 Tax=Tuwongella immobilis TaxID=692036 RepID=A0A6C2YLV4_9BACT|nr:hypothetical protein [Tuwongella immobilis]VIP02209.1 unnamed protein product [Tuwongella immobilis]VTS00714.1 unnamed protein product [Tuwongella immobilis]
MRGQRAWWVALLVIWMGSGCCRMYDRWCGDRRHNDCSPCYSPPANACQPACYPQQQCAPNNGYIPPPPPAQGYGR